MNMFSSCVQGVQCLFIIGVYWGAVTLYSGCVLRMQ